MTVTLVTGANQGIGRETARRLLAAGHDVHLGARDPDRGRQAAAELGARFVQLDVTDGDSVRAALDTIARRAGRLDVLVNNAGVPDNTADITQVSGEVALEVLDVNVAGVVRVTQASLDLLGRSEDPVVVNVSSGLGSFAATTDPGRPESSTPLVVYAASKAALSMLTLKYAQALPHIRFLVACPGLTDTRFAAGFPGAQPVQRAVEVVVRLATSGAEVTTGTAWENDGPLGW